METLFLPIPTGTREEKEPNPLKENSLKHKKDDIEKIKTSCCDSTWSVKNKLWWVCDECGKDVTHDILLIDMLIKSKDNGNNREE